MLLLQSLNISTVIVLKLLFDSIDFCINFVLKWAFKFFNLVSQVFDHLIFTFVYLNSSYQFFDFVIFCHYLFL